MSRSPARNGLSREPGGGLTQKELAKRIGVNPSRLARWERGEREPAGRFAESPKRLLDAAKAEDADVRRAG